EEEDVQEIPDEEVHTGKFMKLCEKVRAYFPESRELSTEPEAAHLIDQVHGHLTRPSLGKASWSLGVTRAWGFVKREFQRRQDRVRSGGKRPKLVLKSRFSGRRGSRVWYATGPQPDFARPPAFSAIAAPRRSAKSGNDRIYFTITEHREVLRTLHHLLEVLSFSEFVSASVASHLLRASSDLSDGRLEDVPTLVEESSGFLSSLGSSLRSAFGLITTVFATAQLKSREVLLKELGANVPADVVDNLLYSEPVLDSLLSGEAIAAAKAIIETQDTRSLALKAIFSGSSSGFKRPQAPAPAFKRPFPAKTGAGGGGQSWKKKKGTGKAFRGKGRGGPSTSGSGANR
ncbi:MAG: hypothetical protein AAGM46_27960, partial [Cyanobacteria bacterium J06582_2]